VAREMERLRTTWVNPKLLPAESMMQLFGQPLEREHSLQELLRRPSVRYPGLMALPNAGPGIADTQAAEQVEIQTKYQGYIERQRDEVERQEHFETQKLPNDLDYGTVRGLSTEVQQKLNTHRPETVGQAGRISGMTPAAISLLLVHLKRGFKSTDSGATAQSGAARRQTGTPG